MKPITQKLIDSFRWRRQYFGREFPLARRAAASALRQDRRNVGNWRARRQQAGFRDYRRHMATLNAADD